jgi:hypothetical protein
MAVLVNDALGRAPPRDDPSAKMSWRSSSVSSSRKMRSVICSSRLSSIRGGTPARGGAWNVGSSVSGSEARQGGSSATPSRLSVSVSVLWGAFPFRRSERCMSRRPQVAGAESTIDPRIA